MHKKVVELGLVRELLTELDLVRHAIRWSNVKGFSLTVMGDDGQERTYMAGAYKADSQGALKALLRLSAARMLAEDEPLPPPES